jgi:hypothetical protein|tara:strand:- start:1463 stop:1660 length:198 start_codon:yes stop_codon:yes gene_type:complete
MKSIIKNIKKFIKNSNFNKNWLSIYESKNNKSNKNIKIENKSVNNYYKPSHYDEVLEEMGKNGGL